MIKKTSKGYKVTSEKGKNLSAPDLSKKGAEERLQEVEMFKRMDKGAKRTPKYKPAYR